MYVHGAGGTNWRVHGQVVSLGGESTVHGALFSPGSYLSVHSPVGATRTMHVYFYNSSDPGDPNLYNWAAGPSGHFELLVPRPGQKGGGVNDSTQRNGPDNAKRGATKGSPARRLPAGGRIFAAADRNALETEEAARAEV